MSYLVAQKQGPLPHRLLHFLVTNETVSLGRLSMSASAGVSEGGEQAVHLAGVMLDQVYRALEFDAILYGQAAVGMPRD